MTPLWRLTGAVAALLGKRRVERDLDDEIGAFLEAAIEAKVRAGLSRAAATRAARRELGSVEAIKDHTRDAGWETGVEHLWRDLCYAARTLRRAPAFSTIAVVTLALGIGANTAIFGAVNAILLRPLPVDRPDELIELSAAFPSGVEHVFSYAAYRRFANEGAAVVDAVAGSRVRRDAITLDGPPEPVDYKGVSGNYFATLGVRAAAGRLLVPADDREAPGEPVAVLSDAYWTHRFGRDPSVVGRSVPIKATAFTIVGVAPRGFFGETVGEAPDVWIPMTAQPGAPPFLWNGHSTTWLRILARLKPGVTVAQAAAVLDPIYSRIRAEMVGAEAEPSFRQSLLASRLRVAEARGGSSTLREPLSAPLLVLMAIVGLVLIIACANVANLMLARSVTRRRETALCLALGAGRLRMIRHGLAEAVLIAGLGAVGGMAIAAWASSVFASLIAGVVPIALDFRPDARVLAFTLAVSSLTAVACGLIPAMRAAAVDPLPALASRGGGNTRSLLSRGLVVTQIAVSLILLVAAGLFVRSLLELRRVDPGFDAERVLLFQLAPPLDRQAVSLDQMRQLYRRLAAHAEQMPGVVAATLSRSGVLTSETWGNSVAIEGFEPQPGVTPRTFANAIGARYFEVMGMTLRRGRPFGADDGETAPRVTIVNETFARQFLGGADPLGRRVGLCTSSPCNVPPAAMMAIVGVAADAKYVNLREAPRPMLYVPVLQHTQPPREIAVLTAGEPRTVAAALHRELAGVDRRLAIVGMSELRDQVERSLVAERLVARFAATFGLLALALATIGLYGLVAYVTTQRAGEIGIRMALGANRGDVRRLVLRDTAVLVAIGVAIGLPAAFAASRLLSSLQLLYGVGATDPVAVSVGLVALFVAALAAGYLPARRAARVDPLIALRAE